MSQRKSKLRRKKNLNVLEPSKGSHMSRRFFFFFLHSFSFHVYISTHTYVFSLKNLIPYTHTHTQAQKTEAKFLSHLFHPHKNTPQTRTIKNTRSARGRRECERKCKKKKKLQTTECMGVCVACDSKRKNFCR